jgi:hypothetical protein
MTTSAAKSQRTKPHDQTPQRRRIHLPVKDSHGRVTGYRGYVWCTRPGGERYRKNVKGKTYQATQRAWFKLRDEASRGPISSDAPKLGLTFGKPGSRVAVKA